MKYRSLLRWMMAVGVTMLIPSFFYMGFKLEAFNQEGSTVWWILFMLGFVFTLAPAMSILFVSNIWRSIDKLEILEDNKQAWIEKYRIATVEYEKAKDKVVQITEKMQLNIERLIEELLEKKAGK